MTAYSYSQLNKYTQCPRAYEALHISRRFKRESGPEAVWGTEVHTACECRLQSPDYDAPPGMDRYMKTVDEVRGRLKEYDIYTEQRLAVDEFYQPAEWSDSHLRGVVDLLALQEERAVVLDWKTGKFREGTAQLEFYTMLTFFNYPEVETISGYLVFLKPRKMLKEEYTRKALPSIVARFARQVSVIEEDEDFIPCPSGLCRRHCPVLDCASNGNYNGGL